MHDKNLFTMQVFDEYERRFARARAEKTLEIPTSSSQKDKVLSGVKNMLCFNESLIPSISNAKVEKQRDFINYVEYQVVYNTWKDVFGTVTVMMPKTDKRTPVAFVLCGHGKNGRLSESYSLMAHRLAKSGVAVILPDNIGQGDREFMGHWKVLSPLYAGLNLQGLIVAETLGLIRAVKNHPRIDATNMCACGNSGGGTLSLFLTVLAPELKAVACSGYPSEFSCILSKEKTHCACNLLKGCAVGPEMWEILSTFAPKPLLLEQGKNDDLIPKILAKKNARKVKQIYTVLGAESNFEFALTDTKHTWAEEDRVLIAEFLLKALNVTPCKDVEEQELLTLLEDRSVTLPKNAIGVDELVFNLTGKKTPSDISLANIIPPTFKGERLNDELIDQNFDGLDVMRIFAQMEYALKK